ncbi:MAG: BrnT family toxin [Chloroflexaceae bacterium]|nr:BrnT family toxin [Chloroflexaceae bacterium]
MKYEWDEQKRQSNLRKHQLDFTVASQIFEGPIVERQDLRYNYGEDRFIAVGMAAGMMITVVYTWRGEKRRLISARPATKNERKIYRELYF